ncbi:calcium-binding protein [Pimelobacter simplex]|uniref:calcium-binding protein n=1 Tax=Nocardioides simplex TaxID=2045 RepID=UPI00214FD294|nr:calcium-binding protein [Pimelobacter simplex]UUW87218.1 hypothetical protein M0M43_15855 [Pimelobacter simplex]UUW96724.1 hypothetical protein M0M48_04500 [Pimelobacter simplex]
MQNRRTWGALAALSLITVTTAVAVPGAMEAVAAAARPSCGGLRATIVGTARADVIRGTRGRDVIVAKGGADRIDGRGGKDVICAGPGDDRVTVPARGRGTRVLGGPGDDVLTARAGGVALVGEAGDDQIFGADVPGRADGGPGDDLIVLGRGNDTRVHGGPGNDRLQGGGGNDRLDGDDGVDVCRGGPGTDTCHGGAPGGPQNSPDDPDTCLADVEVKLSCHVEGVPARWRLVLEGTSDYTNGSNHRTEISWVLTAYVEQYFRQDGKTWYLLGSGLSGRWTGTGANGECTIEGRGELADGDLSVTMALDEVSETYTFEWGGLATRAPGTITCPWGTSSYAMSTRATDRVAYAAWNPADLETPLTGSRSVQPDGPGGGLVVDYTWRLERADP